MKPNEVPIQYTLNLDQVNLIITALSRMPYEQVADLVNAIRAVALQALQDAEAAAQTPAE